MSAEIIALPRPFRPHLAHTVETLDNFLFGPGNGEFGPAEPNEPNSPIEGRVHFGLRERREDRAEIDRIKLAARAARTAHDKPAKPCIAPNIEKASDLADGLAQIMREIASVSGKAKYHLLAQDAELLSERLCHALAELG